MCCIESSASGQLTRGHSKICFRTSFEELFDSHGIYEHISTVHVCIMFERSLVALALAASPSAGPERGRRPVHVERRQRIRELQVKRGPALLVVHGRGADLRRAARRRCR